MNTPQHIKESAANWAERGEKLLNPVGVLDRQTCFRIGAFRTFEWLERNGFEVRKV